MSANNTCGKKICCHWKHTVVSDGGTFKGSFVSNGSEILTPSTFGAIGYWSRWDSIRHCPDQPAIRGRQTSCYPLSLVVCHLAHTLQLFVLFEETSAPSTNMLSSIVQERTWEVLTAQQLIHAHVSVALHHRHENVYYPWAYDWVSVLKSIKVKQASTQAWDQDGFERFWGTLSGVGREWSRSTWFDIHIYIYIYVYILLSCSLYVRYPFWYRHT